MIAANQDITSGISLRDWLEIGGFLVAVTAYIVNARSAASRASAVAGALTGRLEVIDATLEDFKEEVKSLQKVMLTQVQQTEQINNMDSRLIAEGRRLDRMEQVVFKIPTAGK